MLKDCNIVVTIKIITYVILVKVNKGERLLIKYKKQYLTLLMIIGIVVVTCLGIFGYKHYETQQLAEHKTELVQKAKKVKQQKEEEAKKAEALAKQKEAKAKQLADKKAKVEDNKKAVTDLQKKKADLQKQLNNLK